MELFANDPLTTVTSGGTDAPASGTVQTWTVASSAGFPAASTGSAQFHAGDPLRQTEVIAVTNVSGTTWTVTRGAEGTTPLAHSPGFSVQQVISAGVLGSFAQALAPSGDTTGATDTAAIQSLLNGGGGVLQYATFYIDAPLSFPPGADLSGTESADPVTWSDARAGTVIKAVSTFSGTEMLAWPDVGHAVTQGPQLVNIALDGSLLPGTTDGIRANGPVNQACIRNVVISGVTGAGINCVNDASASGQTYPYGWDVQHVRIYSQGQQGLVIPNHTDGTWIDVHVLGNAAHTSGHGWSLSGPCPNSRFIGCRAEWAGAGKDGFHLTGAWGTGTGSGGMTFAGCSTDRNDNNGVFCNVTGTVPVTFTGCMFRRDGRNSGNGGGGFAGINVSSATIPLTFSNCTVFPGVDDNGAGTNSPQYGASVASSSAVTITSGYIQGASAGLHNGGGNTLLYTGPEVVLASGTTASPVLASPTLLPATVLPIDATAADILPDGTQAAGGNGLLTDSGHIHPALVPALPSDHGLLAWNMDVATLGSSTVMASETLYLMGLFIRRPITVGHIWLAIGTAGTGSVTAAGAGLFNSSGTLLGSSASTAWATAVGPTSIAITVVGGQSLSITPGLYWAGVFVQQASSPPFLRNGNAGTTSSNMGLSASGYRFAVNGTTVTSLANITPGSNSETGVIPYFAGVS